MMEWILWNYQDFKIEKPLGAALLKVPPPLPHVKKPSIFTGQGINGWYHPTPNNLMAA